jgi:uncharacterized protein YkwD
MVGAGSRRRALGVVAIVVVLGAGLAGCKRDPGPASRDRVVWDHNATRIALGLDAFAVDDRATWNAQLAANRVAADSGSTACVLNHTSDDELRADYRAAGVWGENIGCFPGCMRAAPGATQDFLNSAAHRANILSPDYRRFGVGVSCNERYLFVAVQFTG